jgi:pilus assembly protein Flp/PilA
MRHLAKTISRLLGIKSERGATAIEYALLASLIAVVIIATVAALGTRLSAVFANVSSSF